MVEHYSGVFGIAPATLVMLAAGLGVLLFVLTSVLRTRCSRCGSWFAAAFVGSQQAGTYHEQVRTLETYRCTTCSHEWTVTRYWRR